MRFFYLKNYPCLYKTYLVFLISDSSRKSIDNDFFKTKIVSSYVYHNTTGFLVDKMIYDGKICKDFEITDQNEYDYFHSSVYLRS